MKANNWSRMGKRIAFSIIAVCVSLQVLFAQAQMPNKAEIEREEYRLKQSLEPILIDVLKDQYVALSVNIFYVLQHDPILSRDSQIEKFNLPGFNSKAVIANKPGEISGFIDKYLRHRMLVMMVNDRLTPALEASITQLLKEKAGLNLGRSDRFNVQVVDAERVEEPESAEAAISQKAEKDKKKQIDKLFNDIDEDRKEKQKRLAKLFPDLAHPPEQVDPRKEAEASQHLIQSREAFFNNDLNGALNEVIEAININPYASKNYEMLGSIYYRLNWKNLALSNWTKALVLDPDNQKLNQYIDRVKREL